MKTSEICVFATENLDMETRSEDKNITFETTNTENKRTSFEQILDDLNNSFVKVDSDQADIFTGDENDTKDEQINHETYQDFLQNVIITEDELSACFEDEIEYGTDYFYRAEDNTSQTNLDPTMYFCRFSNSFNNSWMNATMQSILNLSIARRFVAHYPEAVFGALSGTPLFASLFLTAMQHPGKYFSPEEMYNVQMEICQSIESVGLAQEDDLTNFLSALLDWLDPCGMSTSCMLYTATACEKCQEAFLDIRELGPILSLPPPIPYDSITSLLNRWVSETYAECCEVCLSNLKRKDILNHTDVIALYLPRSYSQVDLNYPVTPSLTIDIPVKAGTQLYHLSSVICRQTLSPQMDHFYTYLMCGQLVFKAEDDQVTISNITSVADICHNGFIYVYEKYTEGQDDFSDGVKVTTDQGIFNPEMPVNSQTMSKFRGNLKASKNYNSQIDEAITKNDENTCFETEETSMESTVNTTNETYCCTHDVSAENRSTIEDKTGTRGDKSNVEKTENTMESIHSEDTTLLAYTVLVQEEMITEDETDTNDEQIDCETHLDFSQNLIITDDELSGFCEDEIENSTDYFFRAEDNTSQTNLDPTMYFCRFSNSFNNSWMNATMQSILNLSIARRFVAHYPEAVFGALSGTPLFASLFLTAMQHPGKYFSPEEMYNVQMEICQSIESVGLAQEDDLTNFLSALLDWLVPCGMSTSCMLYTATACEKCQEAFLDIRELGPILSLPLPLPYDSITSLLNRWVSETYAECCEVCLSNLRRKDIFNHTDVIALYLPRSYSQVNLNYPVTPSLTIDIPVKAGTQLYRLSSVICRQTLSSQMDHFYTYLMCGQLFFKAEDDRVTISNITSVADICHNGFIYVYEKYTEGQDDFSDGVKVTTDQGIFNPEMPVNSQTMSKFRGNLKASKNYNSQIDEAITKNDENTCFETEETSMESTVNMTNETYCCTHDVSAENRSTIEDKTGTRGDKSNVEKTENTMESIHSEDTTLLAYTDLVQEEMITEDETDTNDEQIDCETHLDFSQNSIITDDELSGFSEDEIENSTDYFFRAEDNTSQINCNSDPTMYFCRFSNSFNNSWMNATMQSILNLSIARRFVAHYPEAVFGALSGTPLFASLFRTAMQHPGKYFSPGEIFKVQMEISQSIESVGLAQEDNLTNFLCALLVWLNPCGMSTSCMLYTAITCERCHDSLLDIRELGPILYLPTPLPYDSITSLLNRWVSEAYAECCDVCHSNLKRKDILNRTDVIALYLPRSHSQVDLNYPVTPSLTIDMPVKAGTQLYRLSSVICRQTLSPQMDHFYTYLMCGQLFFKAEDDQVTISNITSVADICYNGFIYVYEKYTEGQDDFSVGLKLTTDNHEVHQDPLQYVVNTDDELSISFENEIQNGSYYFSLAEDNTSQRNSNVDPTIYICRFSNSFNNSWMNATMQSILNLSVARKSVVECPSKVFGALSATPICASLLLTAMRHPGKYFSSEEIYQVLMEISESLPLLGLTQQNYIATFLGTILRWLNPCGINSAWILNNIITCEQCKLATPVFSDIGPIVYLSNAKPNETTASLLHRFVLKDCYEYQCNICLSKTKRNIFLSDTDVITLHLQRPTNQGGFRIPVIPSACIDISLQNGAQLFSLSSVICRQTLSSQTDHFYTYLKYGQVIFKAEDDQITVAHKDSAEDLYQNGFMYIYEKE